MNRRNLRATLLAAMLLAVPLPSHATTIVEPTLDQLIDESGLIARVRVSDVRYAIADEVTGLCTPTTLTVLETLKGDWSTAAPIEFCLPGGIAADGKVQTIVGAPLFAIGDVYLVFLTEERWGITPIARWWHGALREAGEGGRTVLVRGDGQALGAVEQGKIKTTGAVAEDMQSRFFASLGADLRTVPGAHPSPQGQITMPSRSFPVSASQTGVAAA